jgi:hypothetical protein
MQYWSTSARCGETDVVTEAGAATDLGATGVEGAWPLPAITRHNTSAAVAIAVLIRRPAEV